eukprot:4215107-Amphidinium_carterae.1
MSLLAHQAAVGGLAAYQDADVRQQWDSSLSSAKECLGQVWRRKLSSKHVEKGMLCICFSVRCLRAVGNSVEYATCLVSIGT